MATLEQAEEGNDGLWTSIWISQGVVLEECRVPKTKSKKL